MSSDRDSPRPFAYVEVDRAVVPLSSRLAAAAALRYAARSLGLEPAPHIRWFKAAEGPVERGDALFAEWARLLDPQVPQMDWLARQATGFTSEIEVSGIAYRAERGAIWVQADLPDPAAKHTALVVLHECRHRWQHMTGQWPLTGGRERKAGIEADADEWAHAHVDAALAEAGDGR